jgi:hypothetical protein
VRLSPLGTSATVSPIVPASDDDECGAVGGMRIGKGNRSTCRKPAPVPLCPPQIVLDLTKDRTPAAAVGIRRLTAWAMARPYGGTSCLGVFVETFHWLGSVEIFHILRASHGCIRGRESYAFLKYTNAKLSTLFFLMNFPPRSLSTNTQSPHAPTWVYTVPTRPYLSRAILCFPFSRLSFIILPNIFPSTPILLRPSQLRVHFC